MAMRILILTPVPPGSTRGNSVTAVRWREIFQELGHTALIRQHGNLPDDRNFDWVVCLHALHSYESVHQLKSDTSSTARLMVCMTGTDLHRDYDPEGAASTDRMARENNRKIVEVWNSVEKIVLLEPEGRNRIPGRFHNKCQVIFQSALPVADPLEPPSEEFRVGVIGHLRQIKDPFRTAVAARLLPQDSRVMVWHVGEALSDEIREMAHKETATNPRYRWIGGVSHEDALRQLTACHLLVLSSINEGAPSVVSEAIVNRIPILTTRIDATVGLLGEGYPGFFEVGDTKKLARLLARAETDTRFLNQLQAWCQQRVPQFDPQAEMDTWRSLLSS